MISAWTWISSTRSHPSCPSPADGTAEPGSPARLVSGRAGEVPSLYQATTPFWSTNVPEAASTGRVAARMTTSDACSGVSGASSLLTGVRSVRARSWPRPGFRLLTWRGTPRALGCSGPWSPASWPPASPLAGRERLLAVLQVRFPAHPLLGGPTPYPAGTRLRGWPIRAVVDPFALEVHPAIDAGASARGLPPLPTYVVRDHDLELRRVVARAVEGVSAIAVPVGGSSTGKTRACWEAIQTIANCPLATRHSSCSPTYAMVTVTSNFGPDLRLPVARERRGSESADLRLPAWTNRS